ncbi:prorelaxin H2-like isoform X2 [Erinaceus europaeus]|uniref:Prorelaxin H2 isoform X2 n=1 Tax=Erinaceus europaeus TaxID=9365 RepID=A0ABM3Y2L4_ERIEU|nr:prorelaxin H2 isoform X2 [Erinaceus europaeus]XP_060055305.1 prorelaxin H2-like isoform X2 [Erinaceus europaeus]
MMKCQLSYLLLGVWLLLCLPPMQEGAEVTLCGRDLIRHVIFLCGHRPKREAGPFADAETLELKLEPTEMQPLPEELGQAVFKDSSLTSEDVQEIAADAQHYLEEGSHIPPQLKSPGLEKHVRQKRVPWNLMDRCCQKSCSERELYEVFCGW